MRATAPPATSPRPTRAAAAQRATRAARAAAARRRQERLRRLARAARNRHRQALPQPPKPVLAQPVPPVLQPTPPPPPLVVLPSGNVPGDLSPLVFEPLAVPAGAPLAAVSTSLPAFGSVTSSGSMLIIPSSSSRWSDAWLMTGRIVPAGGLIVSSLKLTRLAGVPVRTDGTSPDGSSNRASVTAPVRPTAGGRTTAAPSRTPGWGFGSPFGRFAIDRSGVLLGGSDDGTASVRLVVPAGLVGLAALIAALALLTQRRVERRRRLVE
jgi:hypothetical protein